MSSVRVSSGLHGDTTHRCGSDDDLGAAVRTLERSFDALTRRTSGRLDDHAAVLASLRIRTEGQEQRFSAVVERLTRQLQVLAEANEEATCELRDGLKGLRMEVSAHGPVVQAHPVILGLAETVVSQEKAIRKLEVMMIAEAAPVHDTGMPAAELRGFFSRVDTLEQRLECLEHAYGDEKADRADLLRLEASLQELSEALQRLLQRAARGEAQAAALERRLEQLQQVSHSPQLQSTDSVDQSCELSHGGNANGIQVDGGTIADLIAQDVHLEALLEAHDLRTLPATQEMRRVNALRGASEDVGNDHLLMGITKASSGGNESPMGMTKESGTGSETPGTILEDDHLLLGITKAGMQAFVTETLKFPQTYSREQTWITETYGESFIGYDFAEAVKQWLRRKKVEHLSVCEALRKRDAEQITNEDVGFADIFLSHVQSEPLDDTLRGMEEYMSHNQCGVTWFKPTRKDGDERIFPGPQELKGLFVRFWLDYVVLRQCRSDFDPFKIRHVISTLHCVRVVMDQKLTYTQRSFCLFESAVAVEHQPSLNSSCVKTRDPEGYEEFRGRYDGLPSSQCCRIEVCWLKTCREITIDSRHAQTRNANDKALVDQFIQDRCSKSSGLLMKKTDGFEEVDKKLQDAFSKLQDALPALA